MTNNPIVREVNAFFAKAERKLIFALAYTGLLIYLLIYENAAVAACVHITFVFIICLARFGKDFFRIFFFPFIFILMPLIHYRSRKFIAQCKQNEPAEVVIILGRSDWLTYKAWIKPNYFRHELKTLAKYLEKKGQNFSFYPNATIEDVRKIMRNTDVKEVYFYGHGDSHTFCLNTNETLYYCDFKGEGIRKEYVHQIHCGTEDGTPLMRYVVPEENWPGCFFYPKEINGPAIIKELKRRMQELDENDESSAVTPT